MRRASRLIVMQFVQQNKIASTGLRVSFSEFKE
jgi:hypothetical protein